MKGLILPALPSSYSLDQATAPFGGDLGYFARGSLLVPEVETAAFDLQLEEVSDIITVVDEESGQASYYIVQLTERDANRVLGADLRYRLLQEAFDSWLIGQKSRGDNYLSGGRIRINRYCSWLIRFAQSLPIIISKSKSFVGSVSVLAFSGGICIS